MDMSTSLARRMTVIELAQQRDKALALYRIAHAGLVQAAEAVGLAVDAHRALSVGISENRYSAHIRADKKEFLERFVVPPLDDYLAAAQKIVDTEAWAKVMSLTDMDMLMDQTAKREFQEQITTAPPEFTVDNVLATLESCLASAGDIFRRGIAKCFSELDRRFKSHDGWKIGSRIILSNAFNEWGSWSYYRHHSDTIKDVERVFAILDQKDGEEKKTTIIQCEILNKIEMARTSYGAKQTEVESKYFKVRIYLNGNCHIWFKRDDLVRKVNKLLAEYYGEVIPQQREAAADPFDNPKTEVARNFGFFPTPDAAVDFLLFGNSRNYDYRMMADKTKTPLRVLEPSAGTGQIAKRLVNLWKEKEDADFHRQRYHSGHRVTCVEIQPHLANELALSGRYEKVIRADFLTLSPPPAADLFDMVAMNPPFDRERDIDHVMHAMKFLRPGGMMMAIMSAGTEFRETRKSVAFRELMKSWHAEWHDLPARSFANSGTGTNINTIRLLVRKPQQ